MVSIVTPCLNSARFIRQTIESVAAQDYPHIEHIVMDGGSTDGTLAILAEYPGLMVHSGPDRGAADAVNRGFRRARGEYFTSLNADDVLLPGAISAAVKALEEQPDAVGVYGDASWINESGSMIGPYPVRDFDPELLASECFICQPASLLRSSSFEAAGLLNEEFDLTFDYEFWMRLARVGKLRRIGVPLALSRMHLANKSLGQRSAVFAETFRILRRHYAYVPFRWVFAYECHRADGRDQFFESPKYSVLRYLKSLPAGLSINADARLRYATDWLRFITWRRFLSSLMPRGLTPKLGLLRQYPPRKLRVGPLPGIRLVNGPLPTVSIVTPSFEQGRFLRQALDSVLTQDYPRLEYFVQDGGSSDESASILREFDGRLSGWDTAPDRGQAHAINVAFRRTTGEIMGWLNSDDLLLPGTLMYVAQFFARNPHISVLYGNRIVIDESGLDIGRWILPKHDSDVLRWIDFVPQETLFWRRSLWEAVGGGLDESLQFAIDWDLLLRFQQAGARFAHVPHFLGAFRVHAEQKTSAQMSSLGAREIAGLQRKYLGYELSQNEIMKRAKWYLCRHLIEHVRFQLKDWMPARGCRYGCQ